MTKLLSYILTIAVAFYQCQKVESGIIDCDYTMVEGYPVKKEKNTFFYDASLSKVVKYNSGKDAEIYNLKHSRSYYDQELYIKEFIPVQLLNNPIKRIFKFCYEKGKGTDVPIVVVEIIFTSINNYVVIKYFTQNWAEKANYND
ncbi:hypothetical protein CMT76_14330 [Elizabethkingia anophelis]|nr:hypothetical protein [Elizabethkingia anophelis]